MSHPRWPDLGGSTNGANPGPARYRPKKPKQKIYAKTKAGLPEECYLHQMCQKCFGYQAKVPGRQAKKVKVGGPDMGTHDTHLDPPKMAWECDHCAYLFGEWIYGNSKYTG